MYGEKANPAGVPKSGLILPFPSKHEERQVREPANREQKEGWDGLCQGLFVFPYIQKVGEMQRMYVSANQCCLLNGDRRCSLVRCLVLSFVRS